MLSSWLSFNSYSLLYNAAAYLSTKERFSPFLLFSVLTLLLRNTAYMMIILNISWLCLRAIFCGQITLLLTQSTKFIIAMVHYKMTSQETREGMRMQGCGNNVSLRNANASLLIINCRLWCIYKVDSNKKTNNTVEISCNFIPIFFYHCVTLFQDN